MAPRRTVAPCRLRRHPRRVAWPVFLATLLLGPGATPPGFSPASGDRLSVVIAEVLYDPRPGDTAFVELLNVGAKPVDLTAMVLRVDTLDLPLPRLDAPLGPGDRAVVRFDGRGGVEASTIHASPGYSLKREAGALALLGNDDSPLDRVAWGAAAGAILPFEGGIAQPRFEAGSSIGRPPATSRGAEWVIYPPGLVTPGTANPLLPVAQLLPLDGAILEESTVELAWYPAPGAARYQVQLGNDSGFAKPLFERAVIGPFVSTEPLSLGVYWWRVQAIPAEGSPAPWSRPNRLEVAAPEPPSPPSGFGLGGWTEPDAAAPVGRRLNVPYLTQHKDTRMLVLESIIQTGPHAWDADHGVPSRIDPADTKNCAAANVAMVNRYFGGDLSQDRIGYEVLSHYISRYVGAIQASPLAFALTDPRFSNHVRERAPGPEKDLIYGSGLEALRVFAAFTYALGAPPEFVGAYQNKNDIWTDITTEIDAGRPLVGANPTHAFVITGYELRGSRRIFFVNDPARGRYSVDLDAASLAPVDWSMFKFPIRPRIARQEPEVSMDTDGDGVVDFDETQRFRTSPTNPDSDGDGVKDKQDIESGVFEKEFGRGYAFNNNEIGRDYDGDRLPTEIDPDSDQGGCRDGDEDVNGSGVRDHSESSNFSDGDDVCEQLDGSVTYAIHAVNPTSNSIVKEFRDRGTIQVRLKPDPSAGPEAYIDNGSTFSYRGYARIEVGGGCIIWGRETASGGGQFIGAGNEIGGGRGNDGTMSLGAIASVQGQATSGGCGLPGGSGPAERIMSFPDCQGTLGQMTGGRKAYRFDCTTKPNLGPGWTVTTFVARGWVRVM